MAVTIEDLKKRAKELYGKIIKRPTEEVQPFTTLLFQRIFPIAKEIPHKVTEYLAETYAPAIPEVYKKVKEEKKSPLQAYKELWEEKEKERKAQKALVEKELEEAKKRGASAWELAKIQTKSPEYELMKSFIAGFIQPDFEEMPKIGDIIDDILEGKKKMRLPSPDVRTNWRETLGKGWYMKIFKSDKYLPSPDEVASSLGMTENELREEIANRIRLREELRKQFEREVLGKIEKEEGKEIKPEEVFKEEVKPEIPIPPKPPEIPSAEVPQPKPDPVAKLIQFYKNVENAIKETEKLYKEERGRRAAIVARIGEKIKSGEIPGEQGYYMQLAALRGELPKVTPEMIRNFFSQEDINQLFKGIEDVDFLLPYQKIVAKTALRKLLMGSNVAKSELETLKLVYPEEFIRLLNENKQISSVIGEAINIPRAVMASTDLSAPFRQGWFLIGRKEFWKAIWPEIKMAFSEKAYQGLMEEIMRRPTFKLMQEAGLALTDIDAPILSREEIYMGSQMAEKIPFFGKIIRGSNRAYVGFLNKLRADVFDSMVKDFAALGYDVTELAPEIARFINNATGRGTLPQALNRFAPLLNATLFSPRLMASRLNLLNPYFYASLPPPVRKYALESGLRALSIGLTVLGLAYLAGAKIEKDPRNPDFGKIRFGNSRWDIWGGFQQYIRTLAQLVTGVAISSTTGKEIRVGEGYKPLTRWEILERFFETKTAPIASLIIDVLKGETPVGGKADIAAEAIDRFIPMLIQDYFDLVREKGLLKGTIGIIPALFGVGLQTYGTQELVEGVSPLGKPTIEVRPRLDIGEYISEKLFGRKPLEPSKEYNVQAYYQQLKQMPPELAAAISREIKEKNPDLYKKLQKVAKEEKMGIGPKEETLKSKGVKSGERALAILKELKKLKTPEERAFLYKSYKEKGIITPEVEKQLTELLRQEGFIK